MAKSMQNKAPRVHNFAQLPSANVRRSRFVTEKTHKGTCDADYLIPIYLKEILPGDTMDVDGTLLVRMTNALKVPVFDTIWVETQYFWVPDRLLWDKWRQFMGERYPDPDSSIDYTIPQVVAHASNGWTSGSLGDYFDIRPGIPSLSTSALPFRAYNKIWNDWYRHQWLQDSVAENFTSDGPDAETDYVLLKRGKFHDYLTTCLPEPQRGDAVEVSLTGEAPITGLGPIGQSYSSGASNPAYETDGTGSVTYTNYTISVSGPTQIAVEEDPNNTGFPNVRANLAAAGAISINDLRESFQLQRFLEKDARGGTRYTEIIRNHFQVNNPDLAHRPEYLGGRKTPLYIHATEQTGESGTTPQGNLAGYATAISNREGYTKSFTEHGYVLGLMSIRSVLTHQYGLERHWSRLTRYDFYWDVFSHLGEQEVLKKEIYVQDPTTDTGSTGTPDNDRVFGYIPRYDEYRYEKSQLSGLMRSDATGAIDEWNLAEEYSDPGPDLNAQFIESNSPIDRISAVPSEPQFIFDAFFRTNATRPMPMHSVPGLIDHF